MGWRTSYERLNVAFQELATACQAGNVSGSKTVSAGLTSVTVGISVASSTYSISVAPNWNTTWWIEAGQSTTQFIVQFGTPAPDDGTGKILGYLTGL